MTNDGGTVGTSAAVIGQIGGNNWKAGQGFRTGSNTAGYAVSGLELYFIGIATGAAIKAFVYTASHINPDTEVFAFTTPATLAEGAPATFTAPADATLAADTPYFIVVEDTTSAGGTEGGLSSSLDESGLAGWTVADGLRSKSSGFAVWQSGGSVPLQITLRGTAVAGPGDLATLSIVDEYGDAVALDPAFDAGVADYAATVPWAVREVTVEAAATGATVAYLDADDMVMPDANDSVDGHQVALATGATVVKAQVRNGTTTRTYTVTVTRGDRACAVDLDGRTEIWAGEVTVAGITAIPNTPFYAYGFRLGGRQGALLPGQRFAFGLPDPVEVSIQEVFVRTTNTAGDFVFNTLDFPETDRPALRLHVCGDTFELATSTSASGREYWPNSGLDWSSADMVSLSLSASPDATLSGLSLSNGSLSPAFASDVFAYTASVSNATTRITVTPTFNVQGAIPAYLDGDDNGRTDADPATDGFQMDLVVGDNVVKVVVTSGDRQNTLTYAVTVNRGSTTTNSDPAFDDGASTSRAVDENTGSGVGFGQAVAADDPDGDTLAYTLEGTDAASFGINGATGRLRTGAALDHERKSAYAVTVKADDGEGGAATIAVTVNVGDVDEPPETPGGPRVAPVAGSATSLAAGWSEPATTGPPVSDYDLRYREPGGAWADGPRNVAGTSATLGGLSADTSYQVQVLARNAEGQSDWSASGSGRTNADDGPADLAVLTMHARAGSVPSGGLAEWELRRSGGDMDWLKMSYRMEEADGIHTTAWGYLKPGQTKKSVSKYAYARGTVVMRVTGPSQPRCTPSDAPSASCTDDYAVGSPSSASMRVTAPASSSPPDASVSGAVMTLRYAQALDAGSTPGPKDWVVRAATDAGARTLAVASVSVMGAEAVLELSPPVVAGEEVAVSYLPWAMHPLRASEGAEAAPLTELPVRNETPPTPPFEPPADDAAVVATDVADGRVAPPLGPWLSALLAERPASSLTRLDLPRRGLTDISPLAGLTGLEVLDLSGNAVADAWPLAGLSNLRRLDLSGNRIEDVSALAGLAGLEVLLLDGNGVADVLPLSQLPRLARLGLSGNRLTDVVLLADLGSIVRLDLSGNRVADASPLGDLSALVWLDLSGNPVSDVSPLGRLTALRWLWLDAGAPGLGALAPLVERPMPLRIESAAPLEIGEPH